MVELLAIKVNEFNVFCFFSFANRNASNVHLVNLWLNCLKIYLVGKTIVYRGLLRFLVSAFLGLFFILIDSAVALNSYYLYGVAVGVVYLFWELHYRLLKLCYVKITKQKTIVQAFFLIAVSVIIFLLIISLVYFFFEIDRNRNLLFLLFLIMTAITTLNVLLMSLHQLSHQKDMQRKEKSMLLEQRYKSIKSKTILHFLQNSLDATQKLITLDPEKANLQIEALTVMLRSLLQSRDKDYISLKEESGLVQEFVKLLELQGNVKILFSIEDEPDHEHYQIPPFVLILIFDNIFLNRSFIPFAELEVYVENGIYLVAKYRQLRKASLLQKQDELLKNLKERYSFTKKDTNVVMISTQTHTYIKVPLLQP